MDKTTRANNLANAINQTNLQKTLDKQFDNTALSNDKANLSERKSLDKEFDELMKSDEVPAPTQPAPAKPASANPNAEPHN